MSVMSLDWQDRAACPDFPHLFFGSDDETARDHRERAAQARTVCFGCPVRVECLSFATSSHITRGVWGGEDLERSRLCGNSQHVMDEANTWIDGDGYRNCRACLAARAERVRAKQQKEGKAA